MYWKNFRTKKKRKKNISDSSAAGGNHLSTLRSRSVLYRDGTYQNIIFSSVPVNSAEANCPRDRIHAHDCLPVTIRSGAAASVRACAGVFSHVTMTPCFILFSMRDCFSMGMTKLRELWFQGYHAPRFSHVVVPTEGCIFLPNARSPPQPPQG